MILHVLEPKLVARARALKDQVCFNSDNFVVPF